MIEKMESSESGSMQSSSGGEDHESNSPATASYADVPFLLSHVGNLSPSPQLNHPIYTNQPAVHQDSNPIDSSSLFNLGNAWSTQLRSDEVTLIPSSSSQQILSPNHIHLVPPGSNSRNTNSMIGVKTTKKRSRASRRAPTTVLTTDTSNFRAMVQEFTGIPAPSYASSPLHRGSRVDVFGGASSLMTASALPSYLLRPFPQKFNHLPPFPPPHPLPFSAVDATTITTRMNSSPAGTSGSVSIELLEKVNQLQPPEDAVLRFANPSLELPFSSNDNTVSSRKLTALEEFGLVHGQITQLPSSQQTPTMRRNDGQDEDDGRYIKPFSGNYDI